MHPLELAEKLGQKVILTDKEAKARYDNLQARNNYRLSLIAAGMNSEVAALKAKIEFHYL